MSRAPLIRPRFYIGDRVHASNRPAMINTAEAVGMSLRMLRRGPLTLRIESCDNGVQQRQVPMVP